MPYRVEFTAHALAEAQAAADWIAAQSSPERATRWLEGLLDKVETLRTHPHRCRLAPENENFAEEVRQLLYGRRRGIYRVLFTIREETVVVLYIRHGARGPVTQDNWEEDIP